MKKFICIFLMAWLPLFMGSAWAMNMQMELQNQLYQVTTNSSVSNSSASAEMPVNCRMNMTSNLTGKHSNQPHQKCATCGICAVANASASFNTVPNFDLPTTHSSALHLLQVAFTSEDLPPTIKPPILN